MYKYLIRLIGWPNYLRRLQWLSISKLLEVSHDNLILDLGAGPMQYSTYLRSQNAVRVVAVDLKINSKFHSTATRSGVMPVESNAIALPFSDRIFDRILMSSLLHMVPDPQILLKECRRVLKPDGLLVLSVPNNYQFIPHFLNIIRFLGLSKILGLPYHVQELITILNNLFSVSGPQGYYSKEQIEALLQNEMFVVDQHIYAPNKYASFFWEIAVLSYVRVGNFAFHLLFLFYPLGWICEKIFESSTGSEHIIKASIKSE